MRVVAGRFGGRTLKGPSHQGLRPTSDRVREAVFNILGNRVSGARVLDLFAGTGGLGIEAASRGAASVVFVEADRRALTLLRTNLTQLGLESATVIAGDVFTVLPRLAENDERFSLILADPPYQTGAAQRVLAFLAGKPILTEHGLLVLESRASEEISLPAGLRRIDRRTYGDTAVDFYAADCD